MTKREFDVLLSIYENPGSIKEEIAANLFRDDIDSDYEKLESIGYVAAGFVTEKGLVFLDKNRIDNAIILAAGMSTRFTPLCYEKPKGLLEVKGEVLIERQIRQLQEKDITDILIVTGFMSEQFEYLVEKYGVKLLKVDNYEKKNNHASVYAAKDYLRNTIITSSDLYFEENIFQTYAYDAYYCTLFIPGKTAERGVITDEDDKIVHTMYGDKCCDVWVTLGYAYFNKRFSENYIKIVNEIYDLPETQNKFWADIQDEHLNELYMYAKRCHTGVIQEFDSLEELRVFDNKYTHDSGSSIMKQVCYLLAAKEEEITEIESLRRVKPSLFKFYYKDCYYICDVSPDATEKMSYMGKLYYQCRDTGNSAIKIFKWDKNIRIKGKKGVNHNKELEELLNYSMDFIDYHKRTLPLCAAENVISKFANLPLSYGFQERYIMNNTYSFNMDDNFIGCEKLLPFYQKLSEVCERMFGARYTDPRPFTGMHCIDMIAKTVCKPGDKIAILGKECGGHASVQPVLERLGLEVEIVPYNFEQNEIEYEELNDFVKKEGVKYILLAPSDIITPLDVEKINTENCVLMWDCSQLMGLIAAGLVSNPLATMKNIIMFGGTHKTFPGPASGLIMTNEKYLHDLMETNINPKYLRHSQMHQKISLLFAMIEFEKYGTDYMSHMVHCSNYLGEQLIKRGYDVATIDGQVSFTHQIFIRCSKEEMDTIYDNAYKCEVTLNKKSKKLFDGYGIRLGTQEIARYDWNDDALDVVADIIVQLRQSNVNVEEIEKLKCKLPKKTIHYAFDNEQIKDFLEMNVD